MFSFSDPVEMCSLQGVLDCTQVCRVPVFQLSFFENYIHCYTALPTFFPQMNFMLYDQFLCILGIRKFMWGFFFSYYAVKPYILHDTWKRLVKFDLCVVSISYLGNPQLLEYSALLHIHTSPSLFKCTLFTHTFYTIINFRDV